VKALLVLILFSASGAAFAQEPALLKWETDWKTAFRKAAEQHKDVLVDYAATWCKPCQLMDRDVLPRPEVQEKLRGYVLMKVSFSGHSNGITVEQNVHIYPTYTLLDWSARERFRTVGYVAAPRFVEWLAVVGQFMPAMNSAALLFDRHSDIDGWLLVGRTYARAHSFDSARDAFTNARRTAKKGGNAKSLQVADIDLAVISAYEGKPQHAVDELTGAAAKPVDDENAAFAWLYIGLCQEMLKNETAAREAYTKVQSLVPADSDLAKQAAMAMKAQLPAVPSNH
jgi:thioredoxin-related protein